MSNAYIKYQLCNLNIVCTVNLLFIQEKIKNNYPE